MIAQELSQEILTRRERRLVTNSKVYPRNNPTASTLSECDREIYYSITQWATKPPFEPYMIARMEEGKKQENRVIQELLDLGFTVTENNPPPFEIKDRQGRITLRGTIDGKALWKDKKVPFEIKSVDKNIFNQLEGIEDFNKYFWMRKYILQMQAYLYANSEDEGLFILVDMAGHWKIFVAKLDYSIMENILQRCEHVVDSIEKDTPPAFCKDSSICRKCWALGRVCTPPIDFGEGVQVIEDPEMEAKLNSWANLRPTSKEYDDLDKEIKAYFKGKTNSICGNFSIVGKAGIMKRVACEAKEVFTWMTKIEKIESQK